MRTERIYALAIQWCWQRRYVFRLSHSSAHLVRYCYHDISWMAWTVLIKLTRNVQ